LHGRDGGLWRRASLGADAHRSRSHGEIDCRRSGQTLREKGKKNDAADAAAICEAASRPDAKFVPVKTVQQQGILALHTARSLLVKQQTMLANAMRGLATEFGVIVPKGIRKLDELMTLVNADDTISKQAKQAITGLHDYCNDLSEGIETFEAEIVTHARTDETARRLATIPGIGPITASLITPTFLEEAHRIDPGAAEQRVGARIDHRLCY
jgi:transposase